MNTQNPLVSVIIPCFNTAKYLPETLDSLFAQTLQDFEVIAVDDGSTDNTLDVLNRYKEKHANLTVISQKNSYCIIARMNAIRHATGKYLVCLDSDDKLHPDYLKKCVSVAEQDESISIVYSDVQLFGRKNQLWQPQFKMKDFLLNNGIYITALIRKSHFDKVGGFDTDLGMYEDWDLFISIIKDGGIPYKIPETLFFYRQREDSSSVCNTATKQKKSDNMLKIYNKHYNLYKENGLFFHDMMENFIKDGERKIRHYNMPLRKLYYRIFKPHRYALLYPVD